MIFHPGYDGTNVRASFRGAFLRISVNGTVTRSVFTRPVRMTEDGHLELVDN